MNACLFPLSSVKNSLFGPKMLFTLSLKEDGDDIALSALLIEETKRRDGGGGRYYLL